MAEKQTPYTRLPRPTLWLLRGDEFEMGGEGADEQPRFTARAEPIYISKAPVTNEEYEAFAPGRTRPPSSDGDLEPVVGVSFAEAGAYCDWYSEASGKRFRLPTELEWEFACRGGAGTRYYWGDDPGGGDGHSWDGDSSDGRCRQVETLGANELGLYDMLGNVWEWTASLHLPYPIVEGDGRDDRERPGPRVIRGGSFRTPRAELGSAVRAALDPEECRDDVSFRIVRLLR